MLKVSELSCAVESLHGSKKMKNPAGNAHIMTITGVNNVEVKTQTKRFK